MININRRKFLKWSGIASLLSLVWPLSASVEPEAKPVTPSEDKPVVEEQISVWVYRRTMEGHVKEQLPKRALIPTCLAAFQTGYHVVPLKTKNNWHEVYPISWPTSATEAIALAERYMPLVQNGDIFCTIYPFRCG
jgi:hypothetical protein